MQAPSPPVPDLSACDREPIHLPGAIQPNGMLLVAQSTSEPIEQAAGMASALGRSFNEVVGESAAALLASAENLVDEEPLYVASVTLPGGMQHFDLLAHKAGGRLVVELEARQGPMPAAGAILAAGRRASARIAAQDGIDGACIVAAQEVRALTGYDRVMVYRFLEDGSGSVVAEAKADSAKSFLNHRFPASDIPKQARELYVRNLTRVIPDVGYDPVPLLGRAGDESVLDMSNCLLRSISPVHIHYLQNMKVGASASFSVVKDGALWGLIACHHPSRRPVPWEVRETCSSLAQSLSHQLKAQEESERHSQLSASGRRREQLLARLKSALDVDSALLDQRSEMRQLIECDGAAVVCGGTVKTTGSVPPAIELKAIVDWLVHTGEVHCFSTSKLGQAFPEAGELKSPIRGVLAAVPDPESRLALLWFRAEQVQIVEWAGNPHKEDSLDGAGALSPRRSFETWTQTVAGTSAKWQMEEIEAAEALLAGLIELRQRRQLADLNAQLELALAAERKARAKIQRLQAK